MNRLTRNRLKLISIAGLFGLPVITAWLLFSNPQLLANHETKNYGELVSPAIPSDLKDYIVNAEQLDMQHLKGRWVLLHLDMDGRCDASCAKSTHLLRQLNVLLSKDSTRLKRVYMDMSANPAEVGSIQGSDKELNVYSWQAAELNKLQQLIPELTDGDMLLVDPLGNIMMKYRQNADPYGIQKDLKLLFKASQIG